MELFEHRAVMLLPPVGWGKHAEAICLWPWPTPQFGATTWDKAARLVAKAPRPFPFTALVEDGGISVKRGDTITPLDKIESLTRDEAELYCWLRYAALT
jgi:hypothetical protein